MQHYFKHVKGVVNTVVGYTAGEFKFPTYEQKVIFYNEGDSPIIIQ